MDQDLVFNVVTPLGFSVRITHDYWEKIVSLKHPVMKGEEDVVREVLETPEEIRQSRIDEDVYLFYRKKGPKRWTCAVVKKLNGEGFLITAYPTDSIKIGEQIWSK